MQLAKGGGSSSLRRKEKGMKIDEPNFFQPMRGKVKYPSILRGRKYSDMILCCILLNYNSYSYFEVQYSDGVGVKLYSYYRYEYRYSIGSGQS